LLWKYEIRFSEDGLVASPTHDVVTAKQFHQCEFR